MTGAEYKKLRERIGTWKVVAALLGENWRTIARREAEEIRITRPAVIAIQSLTPTWFKEMLPLPELEGEEIRHVPEWPGYAVTDQGRVFGCRSKHPRNGFRYQTWAEIAATKGHRGYWVISLTKGGRRRQWKLHQLVLLTFVGPKPDGMQGCHYDDNPDNNCLDNLRWDTPSENAKDKYRNGKGPDRRGSKHPMSKISEDDVREIRRRRLELGETLSSIGSHFGLSEAMICNIAKGKFWKHVV